MNSLYYYKNHSQLSNYFSVKELCVSEPCGCIFLTISAHGTFVKADDQRDGGDLEFVEDCISIPNNELVPIQEIIEVFRDETLNKIPKIFFIQVQEKLDHLVYNWYPCFQNKSNRCVHWYIHYIHCVQLTMSNHTVISLLHLTRVRNIFRNKYLFCRHAEVEK